MVFPGWTSQFSSGLLSLTLRQSTVQEMKDKDLHSAFDLFWACGSEKDHQIHRQQNSLKHVFWKSKTSFSKVV